MHLAVCFYKEHAPYTCILIQGPEHVKITDFCLTRVLKFGEKTYKSAGGMLPFTPESVGHGVFTHKSDVWAYSSQNSSVIP